jgi:sRNA-binding protein
VVTFLDQQQQHFLLQQSALQINFPTLRNQQQIQQNQQFISNTQEDSQAQGFIDESGNLCILQFDPETVDVNDSVAGGISSNPTTVKQSRHSTKEKTRSSQKRRKKKRSKQQQAVKAKEFGKSSITSTFLFVRFSRLHL